VIDDAHLARLAGRLAAQPKAAGPSIANRDLTDNYYSVL
jgi:hypothetical protein